MGHNSRLTGAISCFLCQNFLRRDIFHEKFLFEVKLIFSNGIGVIIL